MNISKSKTITYSAVILVFLALSFIYYSPVLEGKKLITNDTSVWKASAKEIFEHREKYGEEPLWTNSMFGGMPAFQISANYSGNLIKPAQRILQIFKIPVSALFLTLLGFFILLLIFDLKPWLAMTGSIAYAFGSYNFILLAAGHNTKAYAIAYMAPMIAAIIMSFRKNRLIGAALTGLFLTLEILSNHLQITYYALLILLIYGASELIYAFRDNKIAELSKTFGVLVVMAVLAAGANFAPLSTTLEYTDYTMRGGSNLSTTDVSAETGLDKEYATRWSIGKGETLSLMIPNIKGGGSPGEGLDRDTETFKLLQRYQATQFQPYFQRYWGDQPGTAPVYAGAIVIFLFVMGLFLLEGRDKWWLLFATILSILLSWGKNFMPLTNIFFDYFPGYNKFRAVSMILIIAGFTIPLIGFLGLRNLFEGKINKKKFYKALKWSTGITAGLSLILAFAPGASGSFISPNDQNLFTQLGLNPEMKAAFESAMVSDRKSLLQADALRSLIFIIMAAGTILAWYLKKLKFNYTIGILAFLILVDLWAVDKRFLNNDMFSKQSVNAEAYPKTPADTKILSDPSLHYRVLNLTVSTFNDASTSNYHKSIGGYHGAKLQRYQELILNGLGPETQTLASLAQNASSLNDILPTLASANSVNMLNTKYIILNPNGDPLLNNFALGNCWLVGSYRLVENSDEEISLINSFKPSEEALIDKEYSAQITESTFPTDGRIELKSYKANELKYDYSSASKSLAIFSEVYYPAGWKSFIDDEEVEHFRANYLLRALELPSGDHEITFKFEPESYQIGNRIALISSLILILLILGMVGYEYKKSRKNILVDDQE